MKYRNRLAKGEICIKLHPPQKIKESLALIYQVWFRLESLVANCQALYHDERFFYHAYNYTKRKSQTNKHKTNTQTNERKTYARPPSTDFAIGFIISSLSVLYFAMRSVTDPLSQSSIAIYIIHYESFTRFHKKQHTNVTERKKKKIPNKQIKSFFCYILFHLNLIEIQTSKNIYSLAKQNRVHPALDEQIAIQRDATNVITVIFCAKK